MEYIYRSDSQMITPTFDCAEEEYFSWFSQDEVGLEYAVVWHEPLRFVVPSPEVF